MTDEETFEAEIYRKLPEAEREAEQTDVMYSRDDVIEAMPAAIQG